MDTLLAAALLVVALLIVRAIAQIQRAESQRVRTYRADSVQRGVQRDVRRGGDLEQDVMYLWKLYSAGHKASRRAVTQSHEMSAHRWNRAMAVVKHLRLEPTQMAYSAGADRVRAYFHAQERLARQANYVPPVDHNE